MVLGWKSNMVEEGLAAATINRRLAAIKALGDTAMPQDFAGLVQLLVQAKDAQERAAWEPAVAAASERSRQLGR
jgi:hypothetical protein